MEIIDDMQFQKKAETDLYDTIECVHCKKEIIYDELLSKYGPEGLYRIADKLIQVADDDINLSIFTHKMENFYNLVVPKHLRNNDK